jgi:hypothetical protein
MGTAHATVSWEADTDRDPVTGRFIKQSREFAVTASTTPFVPARIRADPDNSWPEEGGEVQEITDVEEITWVKRRGRRVKETEPSDVETLRALNIYDTAIELLDDDARNNHEEYDGSDY